MKCKLKYIVIHGYHVYFEGGCEWFMVIIKALNKSRVNDIRKAIRSKLGIKPSM